MSVTTNNKASSVYKGVKGEDKVTKELESLGFKCQRMPPKHPFDILLDNGKRIDVKTSLSVGKMFVSGFKYAFYRFRMKKELKQDFADYFILVISDDYYVIPYDEAPQSAIYLFQHIRKKSKWDKYLNAFHLLR